MIIPNFVGFIFLNLKYEFANVFWKYKTWVENQSDHRIQTIRSNNGKEYICERFQQFCDKSSIEHQLTTPYTPQ
jgi:transposase InsO family protein